MVGADTAKGVKLMTLPNEETPSQTRPQDGKVHKEITPEEALYQAQAWVEVANQTLADATTLALYAYHTGEISWKGKHEENAIHQANVAHRKALLETFRAKSYLEKAYRAWQEGDQIIEAPPEEESGQTVAERDDDCHGLRPPGCGPSGDVAIGEVS